MREVIFLWFRGQAGGRGEPGGGEGKGGEGKARQGKGRDGMGWDGTPPTVQPEGSLQISRF